MDFLRSLPYVAVAGFALGFIGSWVKPVESVDSVVDRLEFGAVCAGFYLVMMPLVFGVKKWWDWMWLAGRILRHTSLWVGDFSEVVKALCSR